MKITMICDYINWEEKEILKSAAKHGVEASILNIRGAENWFDIESWRISEGRGEFFLQRCMSYFKGLYASALIEGAGGTVVNKYEVARICGDKLLTSIALVKRGIPTPKTLIAFSEDAALKMIERVGYPVIIKPLYGGWGRLVSLIRDPDTAKALVRFRENSSNPVHKIYYVQEYIECERDIRAFVVGEEVVAAIYRYKLEGDWRSNAARGAVTRRCPVTGELEDLSLRAAEAVGGGILGVDLMETPNGLVVHEVNHVPQFKAVERENHVKIADLIVEYSLKAFKS